MPAKKYPCPFCDKKFISNALLETHNSKHTGIKKFSCSTCSKRFTTKVTLQQHELVVHCKDPNGEFQCMECGKRWSDKKALELHHLYSHFYPSRNEKLKPAGGTGRRGRGRPIGSGTTKLELPTTSSLTKLKRKCTVCGHMIRHYYMETHMKKHRGMSRCVMQHATKCIFDRGQFEKNAVFFATFF